MDSKMMTIFSRRSVGKVMASVAIAAGLAFGMAGVGSAPAQASEGHEAKKVNWPFIGVFGTYDTNSLRRGYKVYKEVCSNCHSLNLVHFRNLAEKGGPNFTEAQVKALAEGYQVTDGPNKEGDMFQRPGIPADPFVAPYANEEAARAALGGALPPDLSVIAKALEGGPDRIYSVLTGYQEAPAGFKVQDGLHYNPYFPGSQIAMPAPLSDGQVDFTDGTPNTVDQMAKDVSQFLMWAAEPKLDQRHQMGFMVLIYLVVLSGLLYFATRKVWADQH